jgi:DNA repair ATPase RecN
MSTDRICPSCKKEMTLIEDISNDKAKFWLCYECINTETEFEECEHDYRTYKINYHRNENDFHVVTKCSKCGKHKQTHKKKDFDIEKLPEYNLKHEEEQWLKKHNEFQRLHHIFRKHVDEARVQLKKKTNAWNIQQWYYGYLESRMWLKKRDWILNRANNKCEECGKEGEKLYVHHKTYERVGYEEPTDLIAVCKKCHGLLHGKNPKLDIVSQFRLHE